MTRIAGLVIRVTLSQDGLTEEGQSG
jgi:hypothetical protein